MGIIGIGPEYDLEIAEDMILRRGANSMISRIGLAPAGPTRKPASTGFVRLARLKTRTVVWVTSCRSSSSSSCTKT